ncbi:aminodeoxychorismate synthase component I [Sedimenticola selenatireducens]|uniref:aminodeoxychorismate synthase n=1 Tax=Sedimenticola selenatireducens TaxID=191960 RepID=A0A558DRK3_9GAMM|nr:aminodeoxychorismate synthase component I [Sedimenticola selenatireducens]TVO75822.1 aminodeoxychorismate synthase component I [Sedimenticola selenatireducens]TVT63681.1 MAG: aminodeoxychorismate synthase component I [Sedimenticola selenatireducens]
MTDLPLRMQALPYIADSSRLFASLAARPWAVFLDSGRSMATQGRYDLLASDPMITLVTQGRQTLIKDAEGRGVHADEDPLTVLQSYLRHYRQNSPTDLPFYGGALGYFSYDLGRHFERLPLLSHDEDCLPEMAVGIYDWVVVVDHAEQASWLVGAGFDSATDEKWSDLVALFSPVDPPCDKSAPLSVISEIESNMPPRQYAEAFQKVQRFIREGDCYQVNLAQRFSVKVKGSPWSAYKQLRELNPAPFSAYLNTPVVQILSSSPERFLKVENGAVETSPIKGTMPRSDDTELDQQQRWRLLSSEKDRAENLMIVDLLRNDLSKACALGSVTVPKLFDVESYATVHHLVSTIRGQLANDKDAVDLLRGCFPGGSITGAPKLRAMEIIELLEPDRRGVYCGSIGYIGFNGNMDTNIAIRTMIHIDGTMRLWAGGGIVADSVMETEYAETFHKAKAMLQLLQPEC